MEQPRSGVGWWEFWVLIAHQGWQSHSFRCPDGVLTRVPRLVAWDILGPSQGHSCYTHYLTLDTAFGITIMADSDSLLDCQRCSKSLPCSCSVQQSWQPGCLLYSLQPVTASSESATTTASEGQSSVGFSLWIRNLCRGWQWQGATWREYNTENTPFLYYTHLHCTGMLFISTKKWKVHLLKKVKDPESDFSLLAQLITVRKLFLWLE